LRVQSVRVTKFLKTHFDIPVIWGGYDPTVNSKDCLSLCDYACIGEGDQTILDIAEHIDADRAFDHVKNLAYLRDGKVVTNEKHPVVTDLDSLPWRDNTPDNKYFIEDDKIVREYVELTDKPEGVYQTMSSRGCPYQCEYCCEATLKGIYAGEKFLRRRSAENLVSELEEYARKFPLRQVHFEDEIFAMGTRWLEEFVPLYRERIGVPFVAYIYPTRNIEKILTLLKSAGLSYACLALESGSERINKEVFNRPYNRELFLRTAEICQRLGIKFYTDVITFNPYEEEKDLQQTLDVLLAVGGGYEMAINKLFVLPGTMMAQRMERDGVKIQESEKDRLFDYYCRLFWITSYRHNGPAAVRIIQRFSIFKKHPRLINPALVEWLISPQSAIRSSFINYMPRGLANRIRSIRRRIQARGAKPGSSVAYPAA
jgi:anaerobic magnesium-protoporphyrin IX monomethyl ester cyclase